MLRLSAILALLVVGFHHTTTIRLVLHELEEATLAPHGGRPPSIGYKHVSRISIYLFKMTTSSLKGFLQVTNLQSVNGRHHDLRKRHYAPRDNPKGPDSKDMEGDTISLSLYTYIYIQTYTYTAKHYKDSPGSVLYRNDLIFYY